MTSININRLDGLSSATAWKGPVRVATTANIQLSDLQTIDGVALNDGDRVLVKDQIDARYNGIWVADTGLWRRARDFASNRDVREGTQVFVVEGATYNRSGWYVSSNDPIRFGTTDIHFTQNMLVNAGQLEELVEQAQQAAEDAEAAAAAAEAAAGNAWYNFTTRSKVQITIVPSVVANLRTAGYSAVGDYGAAHYKRVASEPWHDGKVQSLDGAWFEMVADNYVKPEQFGAFGSDPSVAVASMPDDTSALQGMFNFAGFTGVGAFFRGGRRYKIMNTIYVRITRQQADPLPASADIFFSDKSAIDINGNGTGQIIAGAAMDDMLVFQYNSGAVNGVTNVRGPDASQIAGFILNGNGFAVNGLRADYTRGVRIHSNSIFGVTARAITWTGSGVASIADNNLKAPECISARAGQGGDLFIGHNQYFFPSTGGAAVRVENGGNIFVCGGTVNGEGIAAVYGVFITTTAGNTVRHVKVHNMEWSGCLSGVYAHGANTNSRIYGLSISGNHCTNSSGVDRPAINPGTICNLQYVDEFVVSENIGNGRNLIVATETAILTDNCRDGSLIDNIVSNYNGLAWYSNQDVNVKWRGGHVRDVGKSGASGAICDLVGSTDCDFTPYTVTQTSASYAQTGIIERTGSNRNTSHGTVWTGVATPSVRVGANSRFRRYPKPFAEAQVTQNSSTATLSAGYNVASVTRASVGRCTVAFTEAHASGATYKAIATGVGCIAQIESPAAGSLVVLMTSLAGSPVDAAFNLSVDSLL